MSGQPVVVIVVHFLREAATEALESAFRILRGEPKYAIEHQIAQWLRTLLWRWINKSRLMNPGVP